MKKILIIEDDPFIQDIYSAQLKKDDFQVVVANTVELALEKIHTWHPNAVVLDLNLTPGAIGPKDGLDILHQMRQEAASKNIPVVVLSNYNVSEYAELAELPTLGVKKTFLKVKTTPQDLSDEIKKILK